MSFNLGVQNGPGGMMGGLGYAHVGLYLYENIYYRQWISQIALAFYEGRQDTFVWMDLQKQFRNPEKQQIIPYNLTKEIIDEISILYREQPIYSIRSATTGSPLSDDQKLWEEVMRHSRYLQIMDRVDRWSKLLGTVLLKVGFVDPRTGETVKKNEGGYVQLTPLHGGMYDVSYHDSPYHISELMIGFNRGFSGLSNQGSMLTGRDVMTGLGGMAVGGNINRVNNPQNLGNISQIYWSPDSHKVFASERQGNSVYEGSNPYGVIPAVPFFDSDPAYYYFLPINEPLIYANHAVNMRLTDLNHVTKFQSFGIPVVKGIERGTSIRQGRPVDEYNVLRGGSAINRFGSYTNTLGFGGGYRNTFLASHVDGNAEAAATGATWGPDTAVAVGEKGDFKFAHPQADITGLTSTIEKFQDWIRVNHGLRPKYSKQNKDTGFSKLMEKMGVLENGVRRQKLFREREQQLFLVIRDLWNKHYSEGPRFSDDAYLDVDYVEPSFPVDPMTKIEMLKSKIEIIESGDVEAIKELYKHKNEDEVGDMLKKHHGYRIAQTQRNLEIEKLEADFRRENDIVDGFDEKQEPKKSLSESKAVEKAGKQPQGQGGGDNTKMSKQRHSIESSKQKGKNLDPRKQKKQKDKEKKDEATKAK